MHLNQTAYIKFQHVFISMQIQVYEPQSPPSGRVLTCDCGLLAPMPLQSARPRESVPRVSKHKPPCFSTLDTASCSGTLKEPLTERGEASERSYRSNKEQMDQIDWSLYWVIESHHKYSIGAITTRTYKNIQLQSDRAQLLETWHRADTAREAGGLHELHKLVGYTLKFP